MVRHTPTYNQISQLSRELDDKSVKKCRIAGESLVKMLGEERVRRRLAEEATPDDIEPGESLKPMRRKALAQVWRLVINRTIDMVTCIVNDTKKAKLTDADVRLPFKLLQLCDMPDELFDDDTPKLSREETRLAFSYCMDMLCNEKVMGTVGAEQTLLEMLSHICTKREHVAYFRPDKQIQAILQEIEKRLVYGKEQGKVSVDADISHLSAKIFGELLVTLHDLGIALHLVLPGTLHMVARWCDQNRHRTDVTEFVGIFWGAAVLLRSNPDLAVAPLSRYGRPILSFVRKRLGRPGPLEAALTEYLLRHL